jgi:hypothetical protein
VLYPITNAEFLSKYGWLLDEIQDLHCTEDGCQEGVTHYLDNFSPDALPGFYCHMHALVLNLSGQGGS